MDRDRSNWEGGLYSCRYRRDWGAAQMITRMGGEVQKVESVLLLRLGKEDSGCVFEDRSI